MVDDLKNAHMGPCQIVKSEENLPQLPSDIYYTIAMGSDIGHLPQNTLMSIIGAEENGVPAHKAFMSPGDFCIVAGEGKALPLALAVLMEFAEQDGKEYGLHFACTYWDHGVM